ncbi:MAG: hypothetical protein B6D53_01445 [Candidatus Omnitrophica bacterium 4484_49]|nr:MAG: hypothetical protein B6D53_01445 [Candidatus Omnitrophica bacterium 4484_49]
MKLRFSLIIFPLAIFLTDYCWARRIRISDFPFSQKLITIHDEEASSTERIHLRVSIAKVFQDWGKYPEAITYYSQAIELAKAIENRGYYIEELLARSYENRGKCKWALRQFEDGIDDIYHAIDGYIQIEQYPKTWQIFKEYETLYTSWLKSDQGPEYLTAGISLLRKILPLLEINAETLGISDPENFLGRRYIYIAMGYRKIGDFHNAGKMFQKAGEKLKEKNPLLAMVNFLGAGECFQKAKESNYAYSAYLEVKGILLPLEQSEQLPEMLEKLQKHLPLLILMLDFLKEKFPNREEKFIKKLEIWINSIRE